MKSDTKLKWKRIPLPKDIFSGEKTNPSADVVSEGVKKIDFFKENCRWIWNFDKAIIDYINENDNVCFYEIYTDATINLECFLNNDNLFENKVFVVRKGVKCNVFVDYNSTGDTTDRIYSSIRFYVEEEAELNISRLQRLTSSSTVFFELLIDAKPYSKVFVVDAQLGGDYKAVSVEIKADESAETKIFPAYFSKKNSKSDLSYTIQHNGRRIKSGITAKGIVDENARKVFRGNMHFMQGASKSEGREEEECLLLSDNVYADSIPALMCDEDDVIGEHAANIGKFNEEKLFYMMSRGLSAENAKIILIKSMFSEVTYMSKYDEFSELVEEELFGGAYGI